MSAPAVAGCVALMLSKNPSLSPREVDSIIELYGVEDLGVPGKDNTYGAGRINCSLAVAYTPLPTVGIEEGTKPQAADFRPQATIVRGALTLPPNDERRTSNAELLDITGCRVLDLHPGANDVSRLAPGVYFIRSAAGGQRSAEKIVIRR